MQGGKHMAKQLDCTTSIASTRNNEILCIQFSQYTILNRLNHFASKQHWTDQQLRHVPEIYNLESFQSGNAAPKLLSRLGFRLPNESWIEDNIHIFGPLYGRDNFNCFTFLWAHLPFQTHLNLEPVHLAESVSRKIFRKMNNGDSWWDTQH
jgi:hypothetical protein